MTAINVPTRCDDCGKDFDTQVAYYGHQCDRWLHFDAWQFQELPEDGVSVFDAYRLGNGRTK